MSDVLSEREVDAVVRSQSWTRAGYVFDRGQVEALARSHELLRAERDELRTYLIYAPCPSCGLTNPLRYAADCEQCARAANVLGEVRQ